MFRDLDVFVDIVSFTQDYYWTPLWIAASTGHIEIVRYLLTIGADSDIAAMDSGIKGLKPVDIACKNGKAKIA